MKLSELPIPEGHMCWTEEFWKALLSMDPSTITIQCDNDITTFICGDEKINVNSEIQGGVELLRVLGFNADWV